MTKTDNNKDETKIIYLMVKHINPAFGTEYHAKDLTEKVNIQTTAYLINATSSNIKQYLRLLANEVSCKDFGKVKAGDTYGYGWNLDGSISCDINSQDCVKFSAEGSISGQYCTYYYLAQPFEVKDCETEINKLRPRIKDEKKSKKVALEQKIKQQIDDLNNKLKKSMTLKECVCKHF